MHILFQAFKDEEIEERVELNEDIVLDASAESSVIEPAHDSQSSSTQCSQPEESPEELKQPITIHTPAILASHSVVNTCLHQVCKYHTVKIQKFKFQKLLENIKKHTRNMRKE